MQMGKDSLSVGPDTMSTISDLTFLLFCQSLFRTDHRHVQTCTIITTRCRQGTIRPAPIGRPGSFHVPFSLDSPKNFDQNWTWKFPTQPINKITFFQCLNLYLMNTMTTNRSKMFDHPRPQNDKMTNEWPLDYEFGRYWVVYTMNLSRSFGWRKSKFLKSSSSGTPFKWFVRGRYVRCMKKRSPSTPINLIFNQLNHRRSICYNDYFRDLGPNQIMVKITEDQAVRGSLRVWTYFTL